MKQKKYAMIVLKLGVVALSLGLLARKLDLHEIRQALVMAAPLYFLPAQLMILLEPVIMAQKWRMLLRRKHIHAGLFSLVRLIFTCNFLSLFLATAAGADAARVYFMTRRHHSLTHSAASLIADRLLGLTAIALLSLGGIVLAGGRLPPRVDVQLILALCLLVLAGIGLLLSPLPTVLIRGVARLLPAIPDPLDALRRLLTRGSVLLADMHGSLRDYLASPRLLAGVLAWNLAVQALRVLQVHCIFRVLGTPLPLWQEFVFVPMIILLSLLPISYFGVGIKEGAFVYFFSSLGVPAPVAVSVSILTYPLIAVGLLPGAVFLLLPEPRSTATPAANVTPPAA